MSPQRRLYSDDTLACAVERVVVKGERAAIVGREHRIPYRTLLKYVSRRRRGESIVPKRRGPQPALTEDGEQHLLRWMRELQAAGLPVRRHELLTKANEVIKSMSGSSAEVSSGWYSRFRDRHPEISGPGTQMVIDEPCSARKEGEEEEQDSDELQEENGQELEQVPIQDVAVWKTREQLEKEDLLSTPVEKAVFSVQESYALVWPAQDVVDAFDLMLDPEKAGMFLVMKPGELRDMWLRKQLRMQRDATKRRERERS